MKLHRQVVQGIRTLGRGEDLKRLVAEHNIETVLIAIPRPIARRCFASRPCARMPV